jgi:hypothetical protein
MALTVIASLIDFLKAPHKLTTGRPVRAHQVPATSIALIALGALFAVTALTVAALAQTNQPAAQFTELWAVPRSNFERIEVGIRNMESAPKTYRLEIRTGDKLVGEAEIPLSPEQTWMENIDVPALGEVDEDIIVRLYDAANPTEIYREVVVRQAALDGS